MFGTETELAWLQSQAWIRSSAIAPLTWSPSCFPSQGTAENDHQQRGGQHTDVNEVTILYPSSRALVVAAMDWGGGSHVKEREREGGPVGQGRGTQCPL